MKTKTAFWFLLFASLSWTEGNRYNETERIPSRLHKVFNSFFFPSLLLFCCRFGIQIGRVEDSQKNS